MKNSLTEFCIDFYSYAKSRKKLFLIPIIVILLLVATLMIFAEFAPVVSPFIYTLF